MTNWLQDSLSEEEKRALEEYVNKLSPNKSSGATGSWGDPVQEAVAPMPAAPKRSNPVAPEAAPVVAQTSEINPMVVQALKSKYGLGDDLNDNALKEAQSSAASQRMIANLARAGSTIGDAIAGVKTDKSGYDNLTAEAGQGVADIQTRRKGKAEEAALDKAGREAALSDPSSQASQSFRKMMEAKFPDVAKSYGPSWAEVSAADQDNIFKPLQLKEQIEGRKDAVRIASMNRSAAQAERANDKKAVSDEKKKAAMFEIEDRRQNINANLKQLQDMIGEDGTYEMFGSHNQDMDRLVEQVATDMAKLMDPTSVARPSEVEAVKRTLVKPGFSNRNSTAQDVLKNFEDEVERRASSAYKIRGLEAPTGRSKAQDSAGSSGSSNKPAWAK